MHIDLFEWNSESLDGVDSLRRERLVDFEKVDVLFAETGFLEDFRNGIGRADTHDSGRDTNDSSGDVFADDGEPETLRNGTACKENCSGTI